MKFTATLIILFWLYFIKMRSLLSEYRTHTKEKRRQMQTVPAMLVLTIGIVAVTWKLFWLRALIWGV